MKFSKFLVLLVAGLFSLTMIQSCSNDNAVKNTSDDIPDYAIYEYDASSFVLTEANLESDFDLNECLPMNPFDTSDKNPPNGGKKIDLGKVFRAMNLTDEQKATIRGLMTSRVECEMLWMRKLQAVRNAIMERFKTQRQAILEKVKNGDITREQAKRLILQLNKELNEALRNLPINEEVRIGMIRCRQIFLDAVGEILTEEQLVIWNRFLGTIKRG